MEHAVPRTTAWMETLSGAQFNPTDEAPRYHLHDLIWGVARDCRYSGQIKRDVEHYSVAEHMVLMTRWAMRHFPAMPREQLRTCAMHDAQEGLVGDMTRPMKKVVPQFGVVEDQFAEKMAARFDLIFPLPDWIKQLDNRILVDERAQAMNPSPHNWATDDLSPLGVTLQFWGPRRAALEYAGLLYELGVGDGTV
jgi:hypothetical protein